MSLSSSFSFPSLLSLVLLVSVSPILMYHKTLLTFPNNCNAQAQEWLAPEAEHLKDSYHYLPCNLLANLLTIPSMYKSYTLE